VGWTNWAGNVGCEPRAELAAKSEADVVAALRRAEREGLGVRVAGSGHSFSPLVASDGLLLSLDGLAGIARHEPAARRVWVRAGTKLRDLGPALHALGLALENLGDVDVQALGGALATGTHGTGATLPNLSARVSGLRLLLADGSLRVLREEDDAEPLRAARVSLGALGVVTAARIDCVPAYRLHERVERLPIEACLASLAERIAGSRHFEFFWYPTRDLAEAKTLEPTALPPEAVAGRRYERIGWSHEILPSLRELRFVEMEYALPAEAGRACFGAVRERMRSRHAEVAWPVEYRTLRADDAWLSTAHARDTVTLSLHQGAELPWRDFFADLEPLLRAHGGRPHWGKHHSLGAAELAPLYPRFDAFRRIEADFDPRGRFLNPHLRALLGRP
jgi:FAD/FMN-containing dehydrogenase